MEISNDNKSPCEVCNKIKDSVRFESLTESFICDSCLKNYKENDI